MTATTTSPADRLRALAAEQLQREGWTRDELLAHQRRRLDELLAHAAGASPYYREALGSDPAGAALEELPVLTKERLMQRWDDVVCDRRLRRADVEAHAAGPHAAEPHLGEFQVFSTSGSSGMRGLFAYGAHDWAVALAATMRALARTGARPGERTIGIGAPPGVHMSPRIYAALGTGAGAPRLSALTPLGEMVDALNAFQPEILMGYPSVAELLAAEQLEGRLRIAPRLIAFGSERLSAHVRGLAQAAWGIDPTEYYASTEAPLIAVSTPQHPRALELLEDQYVVEVVDEAYRPVPPGVAGARVLVTNLENRTLPLIRYELADSVTVSPEPNPAGRPWRHLCAIDGRTADTLRFPGRDGGEVAVVPLRLGAPFARVRGIRQFQVVHDADGLEVRLALAPDAARDVPDRVRAEALRVLDEAGAVAPPISVRQVTALEREDGPAAKLKLIVSR